MKFHRTFTEVTAALDISQNIFVCFFACSTEEGKSYRFGVRYI